MYEICFKYICRFTKKPPFLEKNRIYQKHFNLGIGNVKFIFYVELKKGKKYGVFHERKYR